MTYTLEMASGGIAHIPGFTKIGSGVKKLGGGGIE
jgi:hypothetical protein